MMKLSTLRICNFQSFGPEETVIRLEDDITYVLGPNGAGKTAVLQALSRLFSPIQSQRTVQVSDFHRPMDKMSLGEQEWLDQEPELWIEAEFAATMLNGQFDPSVPEFFKQMSFQEGGSDGLPKMRVRLTANLAKDGIVEEKIEYVQVKEDGELRFATMPRTDRNKIAVYYLPARRNPNEQITYTASSLMGRALRAADWQVQRQEVSEKFTEITSSVAKNPVVTSISENIEKNWKQLHKGNFLTDPAITFGNGELDSILRQLSVSFNPSHTGAALPLENLSDGQKSLLYFSIILTWVSLAHKVMSEGIDGIDPDRLNPPVHTIIAVEEPENSLAPHYLGRIAKQLREASKAGQVQSVVATHTPTLLKRVDPTAIRFLRLNEERQTYVKCITLPKEDTKAAQYVSEAVKAYPELYFSRLVILGEGASEMLVLPRILAASGVAEDDVSVSVVPLGGRHVNHFWRLLNELRIPHLTLLDLDYGRHEGGYGRMKYAIDKLYDIEKYNKEEYVRSITYCKTYKDDLVSVEDIEVLEKRGIFFSEPLDLDMMMIEAYPSAYGIKEDEIIKFPKTDNLDEEVIKQVLGENLIKQVLGKSVENTKSIPWQICQLFDAYRTRFKDSSKPSTHLNALARIDDEKLLEDLPIPLQHLVATIERMLEDLPE